MKHKCTVEKFLSSISKHEMKITHNDGVHRHIRFAEPGTSNHFFSLITWPGELCISGDMGTYVFSRLDDMFNFFRSPNMRINRSYWHEKMISDSRFEGAMEFNRDIFEEIVKGEFRDACRDHRIFIADRQDVWRDILSDVLCAETEQDAHRFAYDFDSNGFSFQDFWEHEVKDYSYQFIWCLYAIVWGIGKFDKKEMKEELELEIGKLGGGEVNHEYEY